MEFENKINMPIVAYRIVEFVRNHCFDNDRALDVDEIEEEVERYEEFHGLSEEYQKAVIVELTKFAENLQTGEMVRCFGQCESPFAITAKYPPSMKKTEVKKNES